MMDCKEFAELLDVSAEEITAEQKQQMQQHAKECKECAALEMLLRDCCAMDAQEEVPPEFTMGWRMKLRREEAMEQKRMKRQNWQRMLAVAAAVVFVLGGAMISSEYGLGLPAKNESGQYTSYKRTSAAGGDYGYSQSVTADYAAEEAAAPMLAKNTSATVGAVREAKIIRTIDYTIKTRAFDEDYEKIQNLAKEYGGYVESLSVSGDVMNGETRYAYFTLRVPSEKLNDFIGSAKGVGAATAYSEYSQDVSETYYDIAARLATQQAKMERLNALLAQAENMSDLIEIESAIGDTQYQIDRYMGQLNGYDSRVNNSYVYVSLQELSAEDANQLPDVTLWERIANALTESVKSMGEFIQDATVFVIAALPWCGVLAVIVIIVKIVRKAGKRK
ncbi:MAG: DUF4349 domain-containing protein [Clostridia bacterium]|nr:DUF4349 domain-containing protein [Clostridia bacterium]